MRHSGSPSWRFSEDVPQIPHLALYVRDAFGLTSDTPGSPPRLDGRVPTIDAAEAERATASEQWTQWWATLARNRALRDDERRDPERSRGDRMASNRTRMDDALGLTDSPLLHEMFTAAAPTAAMWFEQQSASRGLDPAHSLFEHGELTDLLQDHPESDIGVDVLLVEGLWKWRYTAERAMCSIGLAEDAHARSDLVSELLTGP